MTLAELNFESAESFSQNLLLDKMTTLPHTNDPIELATPPESGSATEDSKQAERTRGFSLGRYRFRYLRSSVPMGFAHDESDVLAVIIFELVTLIEGGRKAGYRIVLGQHSFWIFR